MNIGDMIKVKDCPDYGDGSRYEGLGYECRCFFCITDSNRVGIVTAPASRNQWHVMFDTGMWRLDEFDIARGDAEVIREAR